LFFSIFLYFGKLKRGETEIPFHSDSSFPYLPTREMRQHFPFFLFHEVLLVEINFFISSVGFFILK